MPALRKISFVNVTGPEMLQLAIDYANRSYQQAQQQRGRLLTIVGRSRVLGPHETLKAELTARLERSGTSGSSGELRKMIGDPATAMLSTRIKADLLVVQAGKDIGAA
jgi:hypothetical protein